jgi:hypothetical protein
MTQYTILLIKFNCEFPKDLIISGFYVFGHFTFPHYRTNPGCLQLGDCCASRNTILRIQELDGGSVLLSLRAKGKSDWRTAFPVHTM